AGADHEHVTAAPVKQRVQTEQVCRGSEETVLTPLRRGEIPVQSNCRRTVVHAAKNTVRSAERRAVARQAGDKSERFFSYRDRQGYARVYRCEQCQEAAVMTDCLEAGKNPKRLGDRRRKGR